jgi:hypothetical protein
MNDPKIPNYPVVHVTVQPDGSAHVNAAGDHKDYPAGAVDETREQVLTYAIAVAARVGRGVRMTTVDPDGEWKLGVYPDGEVVDLAPAPAKGRSSTKANAPRSAALVDALPTFSPSRTKRPPTVVYEIATKPTAGPEAVVGQARQSATPVATLKFSTGDTAIIGPPSIIGRNPGAVVSDAGGTQLVIVTDHSRTVSRAHADIAWVGSKLVLTDRGAGNGTSITRQPKGRIDLLPGEPTELVDGDVLHVGTDVTCTVTIVSGANL